jgi:hypothetical protein
MSWEFEIDSDALKTEIEVPFIEDATGDTAPNYSTKRTIAGAQSELSRWIGKNGGIVTGMLPVKFSNTIAGKNVVRYGYVVNFIFVGGARGQMHVAGLPIRKETPAKKDQVLAMALLNRAELFKTAFTTRVHDPHSNPLIQYLLVDDKHTVAQMVIEKQQLNMNLLGSGEQQPTDTRS